CEVIIFGHDPLGGNGLSEENFKKIKEAVYTRLSKIGLTVKDCLFEQSPYQKRQTGGVDCGVICCGDLIKRAKGKPLNEKYPRGALALRTHQLNIISEQKNAQNVIQQNN